MPMYPILRSLLFLTLLLPLAVQAVTLGEARVNSYLNQPLDAEIELIGLAPGQHEDLRLRIANDRQLEQLGIVYNAFLRDLRFDVVGSGDRWLVRARSNRPVREPFLDFALQMSWPGGQLVKQYTLLLDPPVAIRAARAVSAGRAVPVSPRQAAPTGGETAGSYGPVRNGETLWPIAQKLKPRGITTQQMAMALLRANPQAFRDGNVNNLRAGSTLTIPPRAFIDQLDAESARAEFAAQSRRWQAPPVATSPRTLEGFAEAPAAAVEPPAAQAETPPPVAEQAEVKAEPQDQLRIVTKQEQEGATTNAVEQDLKAQLLITMEQIESNRLATSEMASRLSNLDSELDRMQKLLELKDAQIAALQSEVSARSATQQAARNAPAPPAVTPSTPMAGTATPAPSPVTTSAPRAAERAITVAAGPVPVTDAATANPWFEQHLWIVWVVLGLLGLTALLLLLRRPQPAPATGPGAKLPAIGATAAVGAAAATFTESAELKKAEEDFRRLAREQPSRPGTPEDDLPAFEPSAPTVGDGRPAGQTSDTLLDELLDEGKGLDRPTEASAAAAFSDDDIASWVKELGVEVERAEAHAAGDDEMVPDDDIPSLLTELDDQLAHSDPTTGQRPAALFVEPLDDPQEAGLGVDEGIPEVPHELDDQLSSTGTDVLPPAAGVKRATSDDDYEEQTFSMSLDLARAYLEIGDSEGARDMLQQALSGARNPEHRRQIEELLQDIG